MGRPLATVNVRHLAVGQTRARPVPAIVSMSTLHSSGKTFGRCSVVRSDRLVGSQILTDVRSVVVRVTQSFRFRGVLADDDGALVHMSSVTEPWHIRYIAGDRVPASVVAYEDSLRPPPPVEIVPPPATEAVRMFIIVGNDDNRADLTRWVWDGAVSMRPLVNEADYLALMNRAAVGLVKLHPSFSTLSDPFWMTGVERSQYL